MFLEDVSAIESLQLTNRMEIISIYCIRNYMLTPNMFAETNFAPPQHTTSSDVSVLYNLYYVTYERVTDKCPLYHIISLTTRTHLCIRPLVTGLLLVFSLPVMAAVSVPSLPGLVMLGPCCPDDCLLQVCDWLPLALANEEADITRGPFCFVRLAEKP